MRRSTRHRPGPPSGLIGWIERRPQAAFGGFLALHFAVWTALPALLYANLPLDLIEALTYGREWQLGYDKLPPLPWWLVEIMHRLFGADAAYYALAQAVVVIAFAFVLATARPLVGAAGALVAVLIIDGMHYFQYTAVKFNHDVIQLPFWALAGYAFHAALQARTPRALAPRSASPSAARCGPNISSSCWRRPMRCSCCSTATRGVPSRHPGPWLALAVALLVAAPHVVWLFQTDFLPFAYASHRAAPVRGWFDHVLHPVLFAGSQIFFCCRRSSSPRRCFGRAPKRLRFRLAAGNAAADAFDRRIVTLLAFGPGIAMIALTAVSGRGTVAMWGYPLWLFLGLWIVLTARSALDAERLTRDRRRLGRGVHDLCRRLHRQLLGAALHRSPLSRGVLSRRQARRDADAALSRRDRRSRCAMSSARCGTAAMSRIIRRTSRKC